jgi:potassium-transporting ATPase KdpC subunit
MLNHIRANLLLLAATLLLCSAVYPLILWVVGQTFFHDQAEGSLVTDTDGKVRGSRLIAQPFTGKEYFQPRPSAAGANGYDASASGASNWAASNALLRDRVARQLGPLVKYDKASPTKAGQRVGPDVEEWFAKQPADYPLLWAKAHPHLAAQWIKDNSEAVADFLPKDANDAKEIKDNADKFASIFFEKYVADERNKGWPTSVDKEYVDTDGAKKTKKVIEGVKTGDAVQAYLFDVWLAANKDNKDIVLERVPADMVMASGSGLDPHITLANAHYQLDGVADEWTAKTKSPREKVVAEIEKLLDEKKFAPMFGLFGEPMVNVLEVNLELPKRMEPLSKH